MSQQSAEEVRAEVEAFLDESWSESLTVGEWWRILAASGFADPALPEAAGGKGYSRSLAAVVYATMAQRRVLGAPNGLGMMLAAPTIADHGTPEQIDRFIKPILDGTHGWCQLFSEPGAGSDLAGMNTKAEKDGDEFIVNGQKVWTSGGHVADWGMLVARTAPDAPKHRGLTYFACDMTQPGITVRPLKEMTGEALFNEVFLDDVRVKAENIIGDLNDGWRVANTTLTHERTHLGSSGAKPATATPGSIINNFDRNVMDFVNKEKAQEGGVPKLGMALWTRYVEMATARGNITSPTLRQELIELYSLIQIDRWNGMRGREKNQRTGAEPNLGKLGISEQFRRFRELGNRIIGADAMLRTSSRPDEGHGVQAVTLFSPGPSIYGGTDQIQRNIIGERVLGLPREPGPDRNTPFSELPKNG